MLVLAHAKSSSNWLWLLLLVVVCVGRFMLVMACPGSAVYLQECYSTYEQGGFGEQFPNWELCSGALEKNPTMLTEFMDVHDQLFADKPKAVNDNKVSLVTMTGSRITSQYYLLKPDQWASKLKGLEPRDINLTVSSIPGEDGSDSQRGILCRVDDKDACPKVHG